MRLSERPKPEDMDREDLIRELKKQRKLEEYLRYVVEDDSSDAGYIACTEDCNSRHGWGNNDRCDCYVQDVHKALAVLDGTVLDDIVEALDD